MADFSYPSKSFSVFDSRARRDLVGYASATVQRQQEHRHSDSGARDFESNPASTGLEYRGRTFDRRGYKSSRYTHRIGCTQPYCQPQARGQLAGNWPASSPQALDRHAGRSENLVQCRPGKPLRFCRAGRRPAGLSRFRPGHLSRIRINIFDERPQSPC